MFRTTCTCLHGWATPGERMGHIAKDVQGLVHLNPGEK